jgi:DNA-directed RNA polymerase subunit RPC12/RpoP
MSENIEGEECIEDEEYHCSKCGAAFFIRIQEGGEFDFDEGSGRCEKCNSVFCKKCVNWYRYGREYD